jgi:Restriction endonuclease
MWEYKDAGSDYDVRACFVTMKCRFCGTQLLRSNKRLLFDSKHPEKGCRVVRGCSVCGWWTAVAEVDVYAKMDGFSTRTVYANVGVLKALSSPTSSDAIEETRRYLEKRQEARFTVRPRQFEQVVASVYRDIGYEVRITGQRNDGGIDAILDGPHGTQIGVQVKRWKEKIEAEEIRSLAGALFMNGMPQGIFVTTSDFTSGAVLTARRLASRGIPVQLVNWQAFFDAMKISRITKCESLFTRDHVSASVRLYQISHGTGYIEPDWESVLSDEYLAKHDDPQWIKWVGEQYPS